MGRKRKISFPEMLEVVLLHGAINIATDTQIAAIIDVKTDMNIPAYWFHNFEEMAIDDGDIIQFNKIKPFIEYVYSRIMDSQANNN